MISEVFIKRKILSVEATLSAYTHTQTHTQAPAHMSILSTRSLIYTQLKMGSKQRVEMDEDSSNVCSEPWPKAQDTEASPQLAS